MRPKDFFRVESFFFFEKNFVLVTCARLRPFWWHYNLFRLGFSNFDSLICLQKLSSVSVYNTVTLFFRIVATLDGLNPMRIPVFVLSFSIALILFLLRAFLLFGNANRSNIKLTIGIMRLISDITIVKKIVVFGNFAIQTQYNY